MSEGEGPPGSKPPAPGISAQKNLEKPKRWDKSPFAVALAAELHRNGAPPDEIAKTLRGRGFLSVNGGELRTDTFLRYLKRSLRGPATTSEEIQKFLDTRIGYLSPEYAREIESIVAKRTEHLQAESEGRKKGAWTKDPLAVTLVLELRKAELSYPSIEKALDEMGFTSLKGLQLGNGVLEHFVAANSTRKKANRQTAQAYLQSLADSLPPPDPAEVFRIIEEQKEKAAKVPQKGRASRSVGESEESRASGKTEAAPDPRTREIDMRIAAFVAGKTGEGPWAESADARLMLATILGTAIVPEYDIGAAVLTALGYTEEEGKKISGRSIQARMAQNAIPSGIRERKSAREIIEKNIGPMPDEAPGGFTGFAAVLKNLVQTRAAILRKKG